MGSTVWEVLSTRHSVRRRRVRTAGAKQVRPTTTPGDNLSLGTMQQTLATLAAVATGDMGIRQTQAILEVEAAGTPVTLVAAGINQRQHKHRHKTVLVVCLVAFGGMNTGNNFFQPQQPNLFAGGQQNANP